jgi:hypothetical protein
MNTISMKQWMNFILSTYGLSIELPLGPQLNLNWKNFILSTYGLSIELPLGPQLNFRMYKNINEIN